MKIWGALSRVWWEGVYFRHWWLAIKVHPRDGSLNLKHDPPNPSPLLTFLRFGVSMILRHMSVSSVLCCCKGCHIGSFLSRFQDWGRLWVQQVYLFIYILLFFKPELELRDLLLLDRSSTTLAMLLTSFALVIFVLAWTLIFLFMLPA
jgi:hypothetical protein